MKNIGEATVIIAKCSHSHKPFGIRVEKRSDGAWHFTWAFKIDEKAAAHEGYGSTMVSGRIETDSEYPGCPYCHTIGWFSCGNCGKLTCYDLSVMKVTCAWCGNSGELEATETFDIKGGDY